MKILDLNQLCTSSLERVVSVEPTLDGLQCFQRNHEGVIEKSTLLFSPFLLVHGTELAEQLTKKSHYQVLSGNGYHNVQVFFPDQEALKNAEKFLKKLEPSNEQYSQIPYRFFSDITSQALMMAPIRLFRGMHFSELRRIQLDIETQTTEGFDFPNAERENDAVILISLHDNTGWEICLGGPDIKERDLIKEMIKIIQERDPDVIEGHNLFNFDLPYLEKRAKRYRLRLALGRDGSPIKKRPSRYSFGENTANYTRYDIFGRHVIDTMHLVQLYDVSSRDLESYGLKSTAKYFGVAAPNRTYVDGSKITQIYHQNPDLLITYALDDVRETEGLSRILLPSYFYQTQITPLSLQNCVVRGNASRIETILIADYLQRQTALPLSESARAYQGGLTESFEVGIFHNIWHMDVQSLYPSIIIANHLSPKRDELQIFLHYLTTLRNFRLTAKQKAKQAQGEEQEFLSALQKTFKILINSFYGYTGFSQGSFNDYDMAETITATGREILTQMQQALIKENAKILEMDTDGIYFIPPNQTTENELLNKIQSTLPQGIEVDLDHTYDTMLCYKSKNYALRHHDGRIALTGAALKSRGYEPFLRLFIHQMLTCLLNQQDQQMIDLIKNLEEQIIHHQIPLSQLAKRESLPSSIENYQRKLQSIQGRRTAVMELAAKSQRDYRQGDQLAYYVIGEKKNVVITDNCKLLSENQGERDENIAFYLAKIKMLSEKFTPFLKKESK